MKGGLLGSVPGGYFTATIAAGCCDIGIDTPDDREVSVGVASTKMVPCGTIGTRFRANGAGGWIGLDPNEASLEESSDES